MHAFARTAAVCAVASLALLGCSSGGGKDAGSEPEPDGDVVCFGISCPGHDSGAHDDAGADAGPETDGGPAGDAGPDGPPSPDAGPDATPADGGGDRCGDGVVDPDEACDPDASPCCKDDCSGPRAKGALCRAAAGACDREEKCDGKKVECPADAFVAAGAGCGDSTDDECDDPDTCNGSGVCANNAVAAGTQCADSSPDDCEDAECDGNGDCVQDHGMEPELTPCGDTATNTECDALDTCTSTGVCSPRYASSGTQCTDFLAGDCDDAQCNGAGLCVQGFAFEDALTPCGDTAIDTACNAADTCDAVGNCDDRIASAGAQCVDLAPGDCEDAQCDGSGDCDQTHANEAVDYGCGNQSQTTCNLADRCDASGTCLPRHTAAGTICTDTTTTDCYAARCNGSGACSQTYQYETLGAPCGDPTDDECDAADSCDASGVCEDNLVDEFTQCTDADPNDCYDALCNGGGNCVQAYDVEVDGAPCDQSRGNCWADVCCPGVTDDPDGDGLCDLADPEDDVVFVTSTTFDGSLAGLAGADADCDALAAAAGLDGSYAAWLSSSGTNAIARVGDGPFVRVDGTIVANDAADLTNASIDAAIQRDELNHTRSTLVWTGTQSNGTVDASARHCTSWTSTGGQGAYGDSSLTAAGWTLSSASACTTAYSLYCFQEDCPGMVDVDFETDASNCGGCGITCPSGNCLSGRCVGIVFVTSLDYAGNLPFDGEERGEVDGDLYCNARAAAASLPGTYSAWLSTSRVDAVLRIDDQSYTLPSGTPVANSLADLVDGTLLHAIDQDESGASAAGRQVWTGSLETGLAVAETCVDWTSASNGESGRRGSTNASTAGWSTTGTTPCDTPRALYCFQNAAP